MRIIRFSQISIMLMGFVPLATQAISIKPGIIRLICAYQYTINGGEQSGTSGEDLLTVKYFKDGAAKITKQDLKSVFIGHISEEEIHGVTEYKLGNDIYVKQELNINRFTGNFSLTFELPAKEGLLTHFGECRSATAPLF